MVFLLGTPYDGSAAGFLLLIPYNARRTSATRSFRTASRAGWQANRNRLSRIHLYPYLTVIAVAWLADPSATTASGTWLAPND
jgi:hypothetical protein